MSLTPRQQIESKIRSLLVTVSIGALFVLCLPYVSHAESVESFIADIAVVDDASIEVKETITYQFGETERHGIFRCIPTTHHQKPSSIFKERYIDLNFTAVRIDGVDTPFTEERRNGEPCIKIGDPDVTISGAHIYEIMYTAYGALTYEQYGGVDVYWNVTGHDWEVPIEAVEARVSASPSVLRRERSCYRGPEGEDGSCVAIVQNGDTVIFKDKFLAPGEGMTIAQAVERSKIPTDIRERFSSLVLIPLILLVMIGGFGYAAYRIKTKHKIDRPVIPQYEPYPGVKPMYAGLLIDGNLDHRDITAGIVYLAEQGFLKIKHTEQKVLFLFEVDDYEITLVKDPVVLEGLFEHALITLLFPESKVVGTTVSLADMKKNYAQQVKNQQTLETLKEALAKDLKTTGFYEGSLLLTLPLMSTLAIIAILFVGMGIVVLIEPAAAGIGLSTVLFFIILFVFSVFFLISIQRRRTEKGYNALDHLEGFKDFLSVTDSQRFIFHNAPERNAEQFMQYLPYAIAFGVEKLWAKTFEGITISNPIWYEGKNVGTFSAVSLAESLGGFSSSFVSSASSSQSSSSGGGFSGGGSGGGGGGSW
jgi:uncharacterized membrane protein YgcG